MWRWRIVLAFGGGLALSCTGSSVFFCADDGSCGGEGRCEPNGYCSFPNDDCNSGWVYADASPPHLAGQCVDADGEPNGTGSGSGSGESSGVPQPDGTTSVGSVDTSGGVDPDSTSAGEPTTTTTDETTNGVTCPISEALLIWAEDAQITPPMQYEVATVLPGDPLYAFSEEGGLGTLTATAELQCEGNVYAWGLVHDPIPGAYANDDPDSFYLALDGGGEFLWEYGCAFENVGKNWLWVPINPLDPCDGPPLGLAVTAGVHELMARNNEGLVHRVTSGIAAVFITTDEAADPNDVFPLQ